MHPEIPTPPEANQGRDFVASMGSNLSKFERSQQIKVGDFIRIDPKIFAQWHGEVIEGDVKVLQSAEPITLTIESIDRSDTPNLSEDKVVVVSSNGVKKKVYASLFGSYGFVPKDTKVFSNIYVEPPKPGPGNDFGVG